MRMQPVKLLPNVCLGREKYRLLMQPLRVELSIGRFHQFSDLLAQPLPDRVRLSRRKDLGRLREL